MYVCTYDYTVVCKLCQILGVLVTYFLLVVQFANPFSLTSSETSAVSTNETTVTYSSIGQQVVALVVDNFCHQQPNLAADGRLNISAILCTGVEK